MSKQVEIPYPEQPKLDQYWKKHECPDKKFSGAIMRPGIDPKFYFGYCNHCNTKMIERKP